MPFLIDIVFPLILEINCDLTNMSYLGRQPVIFPYRQCILKVCICSHYRRTTKMCLLRNWSAWIGEHDH